MAFDGTEGNFITLTEGAEMTCDWRALHPSELKGRFFGKDILKEILAQECCKGIRFYFGKKDGHIQLVAVGADADENDMLDMIADESTPCPAACSVNNRLNS